MSGTLQTKGIAELDAATAFDRTGDVLAIVNSGTTKNITPALLFNGIVASDIGDLGALATAEIGPGLSFNAGTVLVSVAAADITDFETAAAAAAPVQKVAGRTGNVVLAAADISGLGSAAGANIPNGQLIGGTGTAFVAVNVGSGLGFTNGTLSATGTALTIPNASLLGGDGTELVGVSLDASLTLSAGKLAVAAPYVAANVLQKVNNLSELTATASTARSNLGLGSAATQNVPNGNLIGGNGTAFSTVTISTGLTLAAGALTVQYGTAAGTAAQGNDSRITGALQGANNLSELNTAAKAPVARNNIDRGEAALNSAASVTTDCSTGNMFTLTLATNATLANPTNLKAGAHYMWRITQDATGSRTLAYGTAFKFPGGTKPTLSTAAGAVDILSGVSDGTNVYAVMTQAFA